MTHYLWAVLVLIAIFNLVNAAELQLQQHSAVATAAQSHSTALAHALKAKSKAKRRRSKAQIQALRGLGSTAAIAEDNGSDDEDDDDDDEDEAAQAMSAAAKSAPQPVEKTAVRTLNSKVSDATPAASTAFYNGVKESASEPAAETTADDQKKGHQKVALKTDTERQAAAAEAGRKEVDAAKKQQFKAQSAVNSFKDHEAFDTKIATEVKLINNETQSPALASFLGELRTEVRQYAMPSYPSYLQAELDAANRKVARLEAEVKSEQERSAVGAPATTKPKQASKKGSPAKEKEAKADEGSPETAESGGKTAEQKAGEAFALSFFATVALLSVVFAMASSENDTLKNYTWFLMDQVVAIFIAVMYFNAFDSFLDFHKADLSQHAMVVCSIIHALVLLTIVLGLAAALRKRKVALAILCSAGAHVVSFSSIHAAAHSQNNFVGMSYSWTFCIFGICTLTIAVLGVGYVAYSAKRRMHLSEDEEYLEKTDDLENDAAAMAVSVAWTMFVRFAITGYHPVDDEATFGHTQNQRYAMLFYAIISFVLAGIITAVCTKKAAEPNASYMIKRLMAFCSTVVTMNVAWAVLYWGEWEFFEALYPNEEIKGKLMFAIGMTMLGGMLLLGLARMKSADGAGALAADVRVALVGVSLVIAWSWELCFDSAIEAMCEGVAHPAGWKIMTTLMLGAIVIPVYGLYMKPISTKAAEAIGA